MQGIELTREPLHLRKGWSKWQDIHEGATNLLPILEEYQFNRGTAVVWLEYKIAIAEAGSELVELLQKNAAYWQELRVFDADKELYLTHEGSEIIGRYVEDCGEKAEGTVEQEYVDSAARLWGRRTGLVQGRMLLEDKERKLSLELPEQEQLAEYYGLVSRSYVGKNPVTYQAGYVDYRYVAICPADMH